MSNIHLDKICPNCTCHVDESDENRIKFNPLIEENIACQNHVGFTELCTENKQRIIDLIDKLAKALQENDVLQKRNTEIEAELKERDETLSKNYSENLATHTRLNIQIKNLKQQVHDLEITNKTIKANSASHIQMLTEEMQKLESMCSTKVEVQNEIDKHKTNLNTALKTIKRLGLDMEKKFKKEFIQKSDKSTQIFEEKHINRHQKYFSNTRNTKVFQRSKPKVSSDDFLYLEEERMLSDLFFTSTSCEDLLENIFFVQKPSDSHCGVKTWDLNL